MNINKVTEIAQLLQQIFWKAIYMVLARIQLTFMVYAFV